MPLTEKKETIAHLKREADKWFSLWLRVIYADDNGKIHCVCGCGAYLPWRQMQAGHYIVRDNFATRYNTFNVYPITLSCNYYDEENKNKLERHIELTHGKEMVEHINYLGHSFDKPMRYEIQEIIDIYKAKYTELKRIKGL